MKIAIAILILIALPVIGALVLGYWRTYKSEHSQNQVAFRQGKADTTTLNGDYQGSVTGYDGSWQGKTLQQSEQRGLNRFREGDTIVTKYPFTTYVGKGLRDPDLEVIKLDYNQPGNPWWLKYIVDEMVLTSPHTYLGKVHVRLAPGFVFTAGYFTLTK